MVKITVDRNDLLKIFAAIDRVASVVNAYAKSIPEEGAKEYADQVKSNITSQKYGDFGKPHTDWKKKDKNENMYWLWLGTVLKSIDARKLNSPSGFVKWFVGIYSTGVGLSNAPTGSRKNKVVRTNSTKKANVLIKNGKRFETKTKPTTVSSKVSADKHPPGTKIWSKADIAGYKPQQKTYGTHYAGASTITLGHQVIQRKIISDTSND